MEYKSNKISNMLVELVMKMMNARIEDGGEIKFHLDYEQCPTDAPMTPIPEGYHRDACGVKANIKGTAQEIAVLIWLWLEKYPEVRSFLESIDEMDIMTKDVDGVSQDISDLEQFFNNNLN